MMISGFSKGTFSLALLLVAASPVAGAWWGNTENGGDDLSIYGAALTEDWLYDSKSIAMKLEGCILGFNHQDTDGCPENGSEDGTTYWYQMANCMRPQAVFSLYASDNSNNVGCSSSSFKRSFTTEYGVGEFIYYLANYDSNGPFANYGDDDNYYGSDDYFSNNGFDLENLPTCEQTDYGYVGLGCSEDGEFILQKYNDGNCFEPSDNGVYNSLSKINKMMKTYKNCVSASSSSNNNNGEDGNNGNLATKLVSISHSCSQVDNTLCQNEDDLSSTRMSSTRGKSVSKVHSVATRSWVTKLKYVAGGMLLVASFVMFTGILFTNRRRRRALMQRKFKQPKKSSSRTSRSKSRADGEGKSRTSRSKSRKEGNGDGVLT